MTRGWTASRILGELFDEEEQREAILAFWVSAGAAGAREDASARLAAALHFRPASVRALPAEKKTSYLREWIGRRDLEGVFEGVLSVCHLGPRLEVLTGFLDGCGIPHQEGRLSGSPPPPPPHPEEARSVACTLRGAHGTRRVAACLATIGLVNRGDPDWANRLWPIVDWLISGPAGEGGGPEVLPAAAGPPEALPAEAVAEPAPGLPEAGRFTTLDNLLIKTVVSSLSGIEGALSQDQVEDLIEEVIHLSADRHWSYFHRGYFSTLAGRREPEAFLEENESRRAWHLAGRILALERRKERSEIARIYREDTDRVQEMLQPGAGPEVMTAPIVFEALWGEGGEIEAAEAIHPAVIPGLGPWFWASILDRGTRLFLAHRLPEARKVLDLLHTGLDPLPPGDGRLEVLRRLLGRRRAQCRRAEGDFLGAETHMRKLLAADYEGDRAEVLTDLALAKGSFRWMDEVVVPRRQEDVEATRARIAKGLGDLRAAVAAGTLGRRTNAHYVLGVHELLERGSSSRARAAREHLALAYDGMLHDRFTHALYREGRVYGCILLHYAMSLFLEVEEDQFDFATQMLREAEASYPVDEWPGWRLQDAVGFPIEYGHRCSGDLLEFMARRFPSIVEEFGHRPELLARSPDLRERVLETVRSSGRTRGERWSAASSLLRYAASHAEEGIGRECLDLLEDLAHRDSGCREEFIRLLQTPRSVDPFWEEDEVAFALAGLLEEAGRTGEAIGPLKAQGHVLASAGRWWEVEEILERLKSYPGPREAWADLRTRWEAAGTRACEEPPAEGSPADWIGHGPDLDLLFVGGNEVQAQYDSHVQERIRSRYGGRVTVTFDHTGWSSNWGRQLDQLRPSIQRCNGIVLSRYMRTHLGRSLREIANELGKKWVTCTSRGEAGIVRSIEHLAALCAGKGAGAGDPGGRRTGR